MKPRPPHLSRASRAARPPAANRRGQAKEVTSVSNPVVKDMRALQLKKERARTGLFLAEGLKLVTDGIAGDWPIRILTYAAKVKAQPKVLEAARLALDRGALVLEASDDVLEKISRRDNPQMVIGVFEQRVWTLDAIDLARSTVWVALEGIKDPGNLGTIIRTVDSVGASGVILIGDTTDPFALEAVRATMGSLFHVPIITVTPEAFLAWKAAKGVPMVATHLKGATDFRTLGLHEPMILLMGNEQSGLPDHLADAADHIAKIPMAGQADSLNLAVATAIMLYELRRPML